MKIVFKVLYLNIFAFILLLFALLILLTPVIFFVQIIQILFALYCAFAACVMLFSTVKKLKFIELIKKRNQNEFRPDTLKHYTKTLCGVLMLNIVLSDLRKFSTYRLLSKPEWKLYKMKVFQKNKSAVCITARR